MAIQKLKLTEDHLRLIRALRFDKISWGEKYNISKLDNIVEDLTEAHEKIGSAIMHYEQNEKVSKHNLKFALEQEIAINIALEQAGKTREYMKDFTEERGHYAWAVDQWNLWGGGYVFEDIARLIGRYDEVIPETINDTTGPRFPEELENYMLGLYNDIYNNLDSIVSLVFQFSTEGGLTPGTYKCINYQKVWERVD